MHDQSTQQGSGPEHNAPRAIVLPEYGFAAIDGANACQFLQGQLSCDVVQAAADRALPGAYCTIKGRVISSFLVWRPAPERIILRMRADILDPTIAVLGKYGVFSRVKIAHAQPTLCCIGLLGSNLQATLAPWFAAWPAAMRAVSSHDGMYLVRRDERGEALELWLEAARLEEVIEALAPRLSIAAPGDWHLALVRGGAAEIRERTRDLFLPQMLGYEHSGALNFRKGCYTGQEIVARTHYKGALKRHLQRFECHADEAPLAGEEVRDKTSERLAGTIVEVAPSAPGIWELLAVVADEALESALHTASGNALVLRPLAHAMI